ncbi:hypothetical protein SDC9_56534 [bioreactor metagenome]|uniref:Uncharacterized protein n=1 Tax=bioreactor metagenome TaxID=1076179 RepID=A0A644X2L8_9ZZZZ
MAKAGAPGILRPGGGIGIDDRVRSRGQDVIYCCPPIGVGRARTHKAHSLPGPVRVSIPIRQADRSGSNGATAVVPVVSLNKGDQLRFSQGKAGRSSPVRHPVDIFIGKDIHFGTGVCEPPEGGAALRVAAVIGIKIIIPGQDRARHSIAADTDVCGVRNRVLDLHLYRVGDAFKSIGVDAIVFRGSRVAAFVIINTKDPDIIEPHRDRAVDGDIAAAPGIRA